jgi:hypothetical protein
LQFVIIDRYDAVTESKVEIMPRGGYRVGAGGKPTWKHGKTKTIRVPTALADEVLRFARDLDEEGITERVTESKVLDLSGLVIPEIRGRRFVFLSDLLRAGYKIEPLKLVETVRAELRLATRPVVSRNKPLKT